MHDRLMALAEEIAAEGERLLPPCPEPVNTVMIHHWSQALGDRTDWGDLAPPAMIQAWSQHGLAPRPSAPPDRVVAALEEAGYVGVVATNCEQTYDRYVRVGEHLRPAVRLGEVSGPKQTALGEGYFITWHQRWYSGDERVAEMLFRVLKFRPKGGGAPPPAAARRPPRPAVGPDNAFFWAGVQAGELRIQRCTECGALRHPPGPMCPRCHATKPDHVTARGRGVVHSYVVHHHPPVPGLTPPYVVALVELDEGVRMVGNLLGCPPGDVYVGMPVELEFQRMDEELTLPQWRPAGTRPDPAEAAGEPDLRIELTPTFVISTALATRDFMPVHHDPAVARAQGSPEVFLNILTSIGLVQRCVLERLPGARLAGIALRLGVPAYAGETLALTARATDPRTLEVRGAVSGGDHLTATVRLREPA